MKRSFPIVAYLVLLASVVAVAGSASAAPGVQRAGLDTCQGRKVTITKNKKGDRIGNGKDIDDGTGGRDVINLGGGNDKVERGRW